MEIPTSHISISHFPIAFRHAFKSNPNYYTSHGRIYNNPRQPKEIWVTIGLGYHNKQVFPAFESWMEAFATEQEFKTLIETVRVVLDQDPFDPYAERAKRLLFSSIFCPILICCCYKAILHNVALYPGRIIASFNEKAQDLRQNNVRLHFLKKVPKSPVTWMDSRGLQHNGPPLGFNIIFTLQEAVQWPPAVTVQQSLISYFAPLAALYNTDSHGTLDLATENECGIFCGNCGKKQTQDQNFCGNCGSSIQ